ncbi:MAG: caspase family protein, partial [Bacteroidota bacterium]
MQNKQFILFNRSRHQSLFIPHHPLLQVGKISLLIFYFLCSALVTQAQIKAIKPFGKIRALVVGISDYQHEKITDLKYAHRDAEAFATFLQIESAWKAAPEDVVLLTNEAATYAKFINELEAISQKCAPKDRLYIYFSGHGDVEQVSVEKMGYLLFHDVSPTTYASGGACMVNTLDQHLTDLVLNKGVEVILISDACRSGALAGSKFGGPEATAAAVSSLFSNTVRILSCQPNQVSVEGPNWGGGRGLFSYYLIDGLKGMADEDQNRYVNKFELERYVQDQVRAANRSQLPFANGADNKRLSKVDPNLLESSGSDEMDQLAESDQSIKPGVPDTNWQAYLDDFKSAIANNHLMFPEEGSAYAIYQSLGNSASAQPFKALMKVDLASALQNTAQQALNDYITSPEEEVGRRWLNDSVYINYPDYLGTAAKLLGESSYFYSDVKSREYYFRGVNLRLTSHSSSNRDSVLELALKQQEQALILQPIAPHIHNEMGLIYSDLNQIQKELLAFQKANALSPQ